MLRMPPFFLTTMLACLPIPAWAQPAQTELGDDIYATCAGLSGQSETCGSNPSCLWLDEQQECVELGQVGVAAAACAAFSEDADACRIQSGCTFDEDQLGCVLTGDATSEIVRRAFQPDGIIARPGGGNPGGGRPGGGRPGGGRPGGGHPGGGHPGGGHPGGGYPGGGHPGGGHPGGGYPGGGHPGGGYPGGGYPIPVPIPVPYPVPYPAPYPAPQPVPNQGVWCDSYTGQCFPYCSNGSNNGDGWGYQPELGGPGGSCKVPY